MRSDRSASMLLIALPGFRNSPTLRQARTRSRYRVAVDVKRAADVYGLARVFSVPGADADANAGDRSYLVLAKPKVIMNDVRLRGLEVAGSEAAGRKSPHNHTQTARNLKRSLENAAAGARLIQAEGLDTRSAADVAASLADALEELHRLQRSLDRRIRRDQGVREGPPVSSSISHPDHDHSNALPSRSRSRS